MSKETTAVATTEDKSKFTVYVPLGATDEIKLSVAMVQRLLCSKTAKGHTCSEDDALKFIAMNLAKRLNPWEGDSFLVGYDTQDGAKFSQITAHQAFLKRAELNAEYNGMKSGVMVMRDKQLMELEGDFHFDTDTLVGGWACVYFKNREHPMFKRVKLSRFNTNKSIWAKDPTGMIVKCAESDALRSSFPTMLGGLYMKEELEVEPKEEKLKTPIFKSAQPAIEVGEARKSDVPATPLSDLRCLMKSDGIEVGQLLDFMEQIGLCDHNDTLETMAEDDDPNLLEVVKNWQDIVRKIKEVKL